MTFAHAVNMYHVSSPFPGHSWFVFVKLVLLQKVVIILTYKKINKMMCLCMKMYTLEHVDNNDKLDYALI